MPYTIIGLALLIVAVFIYATVKQLRRERRYYNWIADEDKEYWDSILNDDDDENSK